MIVSKASLVLAGIASVSVVVTQAQNWPQWRGPLETGAAPQADPPVRWSETENVRWKVKLPGTGASTPVIWGQGVYIQAAINTGKKPEGAAPAAQPAVEPQADGVRRGRRGGFGGSSAPEEAFQFVLLCLDRKTGETIWQQVAREEVPHEGHHRDHGYASYSPVTDGEHVFAYFGSRGLHCYDMDGKQVWSKDLGRMRTRNGFGEGGSPALHGDRLVVNWDHQGEDFIAAFDKRTGAELWRQGRDEDTTWSTPIVVEHQGNAQVVAAAPSKVRGYDLNTGELIWECGPLTANVVPSPVAGEGMVYATSGFRGSKLWAIRLGGKGDLADTDYVAWNHDKQTPYVPSPLLYGGKLYFFSGNNGMLTILDAKSGKVFVDAERLEGLQGVYASPVGAAGRVYLLGRTGTALVLKDGESVEVLAANRLEDNFDASPAAVGNELYLRGHQYLYCLAQIN